MQRNFVPGKYLYVVCSGGDDHFVEIAAVSIATLRLASPRARIAVLTDRQTSLVESPGVSAIRAAVDDFIVVDCPGESPMIRSRFLKCSMRAIVNGRFLYLDSDTLIVGSLDSIWGLDCDVAASPDLSPEGKSYLSLDALPEKCAALGWAMHPRPYLNSGVIYFTDGDAARALGDQYRLSWMEFVRVIGQANDQLAFNRAIDVSEAKLAVLPLCYNAQITMNAMALRGAKILHFFSGNFDDSVETIAHTTAKKLKTDGVLDTAAIRSTLASGNPWTRIDSYRKAVAAGCYSQIGRVAFERLTNRLGS
jgi:hypothetical protein